MGVPLLKGAGRLLIAGRGRRYGLGHFGLVDRGNGVQKFSMHYESDRDRGGRSVRCAVLQDHDRRSRSSVEGSERQPGRRGTCRHRRARAAVAHRPARRRDVPDNACARIRPRSTCRARRDRREHARSRPLRRGQCSRQVDVRDPVTTPTATVGWRAVALAKRDGDSAAGYVLAAESIVAAVTLPRRDLRGPGTA